MDAAPNRPCPAGTVFDAARSRSAAVPCADGGTRTSGSRNDGSRSDGCCEGPRYARTGRRGPAVPARHRQAARLPWLRRADCGRARTIIRHPARTSCTRPAGAQTDRHRYHSCAAPTAILSEQDPLLRNFRINTDDQTYASGRRSRACPPFHAHPRAGSWRSRRSRRTWQNTCTGTHHHAARSWADANR